MTSTKLSAIEIVSLLFYWFAKLDPQVLALCFLTTLLGSTAKFIFEDHPAAFQVPFQSMHAKYLQLLLAGQHSL